jgi:hypothetical protein
MFVSAVETAIRELMAKLSNAGATRALEHRKERPADFLLSGSLWGDVTPVHFATLRRQRTVANNCRHCRQNTF